MDFSPGDGWRSFERVSSTSTWRGEDEVLQCQHFALEQAFAKQLEAREVVLVQSDHGWRVVKLRSLAGADREALLRKVFRSPEDEKLGFFQKVASRLEKAGMPTVSVEIRFKELTVQGSQVIKPDIRVKGLDKLKKLNPFGPKKDVRPWKIIDSVSGVLKPGRLTLLLGTPGSGRSLLMKALAGRLGHEKSLKVTAAELTYNGRSLDTFVPERTAHYISQLDDHFGELTVRQTLDFAARCHGGFHELLEALEAKEKEHGIQPDEAVKSYMTASLAGGKSSLRVDIVLRTFGLDICADTLVGNGMIRGISGGQKKRVTASEMVVGPSKVLFADEISTGLDSATTYDIVAAMREHAQHIRSTQLIALLQPTPETIGLFDDIMMLSAGKIIFQGPTELVLPFFEGLGFACPPRKNVADFLQEVPMPRDQKRYWADSHSPYAFVNSKALSNAFYATTEVGQAIMKELATSFSGDADCNKLAIMEDKYGAGIGELTRAVLRRGLLLLNMQKTVHIGRFIQVAFLGFCVATLFLKEDKGLVNGSVEDGLTSANNFFGVMFFTCMTFMVGAFADSAMFVQTLPVWYKQRTAKFYPAACFALSAVVMRLPWIFAETWAWTLLVYFCVGFVTSVRIFAFWGTIFGLACFSLTLYLACAALMRNVAAAVAIEATLLLCFVNVCGFIINKANIPGGWNAVYWSNPLTYMFTSIAVNEFTSDDWDEDVAPGGPTIGSLALESRGYQQSYTYVWLAIFVWGFSSAVLNFCACVFFLATLEAPKPPVTISEEAYALQLRARSGIKDEDVLDGKVLDNSTSSTLAAGGDVEAQGGSGAKGGSSLPFTPVQMAFKDICYSVPYPKDASRPELSDADTGPHVGQLLLLKGITGSFRAGVLMALMGASGAGKTTLMDVLAGRKTGGTITGDVKVNGFEKEPQTFARIMGYVEQTDIHVPHTTVQEALQFSARLRLPASVSPPAAAMFVQEVMDLVELTTIKDATVGMPGIGLSVEQRKRLTIAVELVANPSIVFMDEPTSGLDARAAGVVMRAVKNTVATGRAVVCTIHQPSMEIFEAFDELLLLRRGGETIFQGRIGQDSGDLIAYFEGISGTAAIKAGVNAANWMLEVTSPDAEKKSGHDFADLYRSSELAQSVSVTVDECAVPAEGAVPLRMEDMKGPGQGAQLKELLLRNSRELVREWTYNGIRVVITLACAMIYATLFANQGQAVETYTGVLNVAGAMYAGCIFIGVIFCFAVQDPVGLRRTVYYREHAAGTYGVIPYWAAEFFAEAPWLVLFSLVYSIILYFSIGFINEAGKFFFYWLIMLLNLATFTSFGMLAVHVTPQLEAANAIAGTCFALYNLLCGFMKPQPAIPTGWIWFYWLDPVSYSLYGLVAGQLGDVTTLTTLPGGRAEPINEFIEGYFGFKRSFMWPAAGILLGFMLFFRFSALVALAKLNFQRR